jgi:hypothetical protein
MAVTKFETVDGYGMLDIEGAALAVGPVRSAKKVLQRTTTDLIRHATYALAVHGIDGTGAAAALNHDRASADAAEFETFANELATWSSSVAFRPITGMGLSPDEVGPAMFQLLAPTDQLIAASAVASAGAPASAIVVSSAEETALIAELDLAGISHSTTEDLAEALASDAPAVFVRGGTGSLHHDAVAESTPGVVVGLQPLTTTARGLAVAGRNDTVIVPDFLSAGGAVLAAAVSAADADEQRALVRTRTAAVAADLASHGVNMFVSASEQAEAHLRSWTDALPFGRPLAP